MQAVVVSNLPSKRTDYFIQAGEHLNVDSRFVTYRELEKELSTYDHTLVKLEPPRHDETDFVVYNRLCRDYVRLLTRIGGIERAESVSFLNTPQAIVSALDKYESKLALSGLQATPLLSAAITDFGSLTELLQSQKSKRVFIKPRFGSGAGGILALRQHPRTGLWVVYTTMLAVKGHFCNTKRIHRLTDQVEISKYADAVLKEGALVEEWILKDAFGEGGNYDLRVVCQFGKVEYVVVRYSKGPITNLHLNNKAGDFDDLDLPQTLSHQIQELCVSATKQLGLQVAGVDVLLEKDSRRPYIIEVNGQGDHIYRDLFGENRIYKKQIKAFAALYH